MKNKNKYGSKIYDDGVVIRLRDRRIVLKSVEKDGIPSVSIFITRVKKSDKPAAISIVGDKVTETYIALSEEAMDSITTSYLRWKSEKMRREMKSAEEIQEKIDQILADERMSYKTATVFENAPLALIQHAMTTELHTLQWVLGQDPTDIRKLREEE